MNLLLFLMFAVLIIGWIKLALWGSKKRSKQKLIDAGYTTEAAKEFVDKTYRKKFWGV